jgi:hypothetical protein
MGGAGQEEVSVVVQHSVDLAKQVGASACLEPF